MSSPWLAPATLRNLADKLYEKRKAAALEVEQTTKALAAAGDLVSVGALIDLLVDEYALSPQANHRKGGLIGLAAATVGLGADHALFLKKILPPVLHSFIDQDSRVRYYACEALYNIAKVARGGIVPFFNDVFDALCKLSGDSDPNVQNAAHLLDRLVKDIVTESTSFSVEAFIPLLKERLAVLNPYVRQFLVGWIMVLDSVPDIDMLEFLPDFMDGVMNMLSDPNREIRQQADTALAEFLHEIKSSKFVDFRRLTEVLVGRAASPDDFTRLTAITWLLELIQLGRERMMPYTAAVLAAVLPCLAHPEERVAAVAASANDAMLALYPSAGDGFDLRAVLAVLEQEVSDGKEPTRLAALRWLSVLLSSSRNDVLAHQGELGPALMHSMADGSDQVVLQALDVQASLSRDDPHFPVFMDLLLHEFCYQPQLLEARGSLVIRRLCVLLGAERVFRELAAVLAEPQDLQFTSIMIQALNLILLTATETAEMRAILRRSTQDGSGSSLFLALFQSWCHSPVATLSLCLLAQAYDHASLIVASFADVSITVDLLVQMDQLVQLLETPVFTYLRLQLLEPGQYTALMKTLHGVLLLLPVQSSAWVTLSSRLQCVPTLYQLQSAPAPAGRDSADLLARFKAVTLKAHHDGALSVSAASVCAALFDGQASSHADVKAADALIDRALHLFPAKQLQKALALVDQGAVTCVVAEASRRTLFQVKGHKPGEVHTCLGTHFCSCHAFFYDVVNKSNQLMCKHLVAAQFARVLQRCRTVVVPDVVLCSLLELSGGKPCD